MMRASETESVVMRRICALLILLLAVLGPARADTILTGGLVVNQTWTPAGSPYVVQGDLIVPQFASLTIEPGTVVRFDGGDLQISGIDIDRTELTIQGTLNAAGTGAQPILFEANGGSSPSTWYGIVVSGIAANAFIQHVQIRHAVRGIRSQAPGSVLQLTQGVLSDNEVGLHIEAGTPTIDNIILRNQTGDGVWISGNASPSLSNCLIHSNAQSGVNIDMASGTSAPGIHQCTIHANGNRGVRVAASSGASVNATIRNSNITNNQYGVERVSSLGTTSVSVLYSNVWGHTINFLSASAGTGTISANPLYVSASNLRLTSNSPSRFAGEFGQDLGALPYTGDPTPGLYGTLWQNTSLTAAGSPYTVPGDLTIAPGVTLTVAPGTTLTFANSDLMAANADTTRSELIAFGTLNAQGSPAAPIVFRGATATASSWRGLRFPAGSSGSTLSHAEIAHAVHGIESATAGSVVLSQLDVHHNGTGMRVAAGTLTLDAVTLRDSTGHGLEVLSGGSASVQNTVIRSNFGAGIHYTTNSPSQSLSVGHTTIYGNMAEGIRVVGVGSVVAALVRNSIVTHNQTGLGVSGTGTITATYNDVWNNSAANYFGVAPGAGSISTNPQYVAAPGNLHVQSTSVTIDAGTATGAPDHDRDGLPRPIDGDGINGLQFDLGAYEFLPVVPVSIAVADGSAGEGNGGSMPAMLAVSLSALTGDTVSVDWTTTAAGDATAGVDFTTASGTLQFAPGETQKSLPIAVLGDLSDEFDETVVVQLSNPSGAHSLGDAAATLSILDDDNPPTLSLADAAICEGETGFVPIDISVASGKSISVNATSSDGTATAGSDYVAVTGTVSVPVGAGIYGVTLAALADASVEPAEMLTLTLSDPINALLGDASTDVLVLDHSDPLCVLFADGFE